MLSQIKEYLGYNGSGYIKFTKESFVEKYVITYGQEYNPPKLNLANLIKLSELLGTVDITVDDYAYGGCETCDYGSDYGHEIYIRNVTKNQEELDKLVGTQYGSK